MSTHRFAVGTKDAGIQASFETLDAALDFAKGFTSDALEDGIDQIVVTEDGIPVSSDQITDTLVDLSLEQLFSLADDIMTNPIYDETESSESLVTLETQTSSDNALEKLFTQVDEILSHPNYSEKVEYICSWQVADY